MTYNKVGGHTYSLSISGRGTFTFIREYKDYEPITSKVYYLDKDSIVSAFDDFVNSLKPKIGELPTGDDLYCTNCGSYNIVKDEDDGGLVCTSCAHYVD